MNVTEETIWINIQHKDAGIFESYYKEHYKCFFLMACKYLKDSAHAEEIVNDVFVKLWQDGDKIIIETSLKSYIYRAVINRSINALNKQKKDIQHLKELSHRPEPIIEQKEMEDNELKVKIYGAIDALPQQCKKVFQMSRFEALKQQEIADKLGISIKTVKNHITYALKQLNKAMGNELILILLLLKEFICSI